MTLKNSIIEKINNLEKDEFDSVTKIKTELKNKNISALYEREEFCRNCLLLDKNNSKELFNSGENANWSNTIDKVSVFKQLLHKNHLIVDLKPNLIKNNDFIQTYGFTVQQMLTLVRKKVITLNLYSYEAAKSTGFEEYTYFDGNQDEKHAYESLFIQENNMRINSIRRRILFDHLSTERGVSYDETIEEAKDILYRVIKSQSIVNDLNTKSIIRAKTINGAIQQLTQQYAEVKTMLMVEQDKYGEQLLAEVANEKSHYLKTTATLRALRIALSSPFSSSLGGDYSMSNYESNSINWANFYLTGESFDSINSLTFRNQKHPLSVVINNFIETTTENRFKLNEVPVYVDNNSFKDFLHYIDEHKSLIYQQSAYIKEFVSEKGDYYLNSNKDSNLKILHMYLNSQKDLNKSYEKLINNWTMSIKIAVGAVLSFFAPDFVDQKSLASLTYSGSSEAAKEMLSPYLAKLLRKNKYQIFLDSESIKKAITKANL